MASLDRTLRRQLENTVKQARRVAEAGARKAVESLAVHHHEPHSSMTSAQRMLRNRLRAHGRQVGDHRDERRGTQTVDRLVGECAYEHWHRMLFARFLAENDLLFEPEHGVPISLDDCRELARDLGKDWLELASAYAVRMLPQIFRPDDPVLEVNLPPETRSELEDLLKALPRDVFLANDSLGWVYQYWQAEQKDAVNASGNVIGADELPAVTQLFTEDYMVEFLLHNTLGAWWAGKVLAANPKLATSAKDEDELREACSVGDVRWTYLRFVQEENGSWQPAAGTFESWPREAKAVTVLDPCMGSGHFLVFALPILAAFRIAEEKHSKTAAVEAVLRDNLFGLEIDQRCTQIAAFNLALAAWRCVGYRLLPHLNLACSGLAIGVSKTEWLELAEEVAASSAVPPDRDLLGTNENLFSVRIKDGFGGLYDLFAKAPWLGSLIDPRKEISGDLLVAGFEELEPSLERILGKCRSDDIGEMAVVAHGMSRAAEILGKSFVLVATNVPYLARGKQDSTLRSFAERRFPNARTDLATMFVLRCNGYCQEAGTVAIVSPQNWHFLPTYKKLRAELLSEVSFSVIAKLGPGAFEAISGEVVNVALTISSASTPEPQNEICGWDATEVKGPVEKARFIQSSTPNTVLQFEVSKNPDHRLILRALETLPLLEDFGVAPQGIKTGDDPRFRRNFWEVRDLISGWREYQSTADVTRFIDGMHFALDWQQEGTEFARLQGQAGWGRSGVILKLMGEFTASLHLGALFDSNVTAIIPKDQTHLPALWSFCSSEEYSSQLREVEQGIKINNAAAGKVCFDLAHWEKVAAENYPSGLPKPFTNDPTQWIFDGNPADSNQSLQVAVARLLGYQWPRQTGSSFPDCPALEPDGLETLADHDGTVCLPALNREQPAATRLRGLLATTFGSEWSVGKERELLSASGSKKSNLEDWLLDDFFEQHCALFHQRPFIWHVWDGLRDGFNVIVNYHKLAAPNGEGRRTLEKLIYTYLGDWITQQRREQQAGAEGADARLAAAMHLQDELKKILEGEPPYDIFVRWKPLHEQPIGWDPDINDGVRLNIRPFMTARPLNARAKNASILRTTPKIKWDKDRGKEPERAKEDFPWFWSWDERTQDFPGGKSFDGNRWSDLHYTNAFKKAARDRKKKS